MSATAYTHCPQCRAVNPDSEPGGEFSGTVRVDAEFWCDQFKFRIQLNCGECGWHKELTEESINDT